MSTSMVLKGGMGVSRYEVRGVWVLR